MSKEFYVSHPQDLHDAIGDIKELRYPFMLISHRMPPVKNTEEYDSKRRQMAYLYRTVFTEYATLAGVTDEEAEAELRIKFTKTGEITEDGGEFDVMWLSEDRLRIFSEGKRYYVQSIADMTSGEISDFIEKCKNYILVTYGVRIKEYTRKFKEKKI